MRRAPSLGEDPGQWWGRETGSSLWDQGKFSKNVRFSQNFKELFLRFPGIVTTILSQEGEHPDGWAFLPQSPLHAGFPCHELETLANVIYATGAAPTSPVPGGQR